MFQSFFTAGLLIVNQLLEHAGDLGDSRTNRIGATGELRASHRFSAGQIVRQQHGTAANQNGIDGITGNLHGVNGVLHHLSHRCICLIGNFLADACGQRGIANVRLAKTIGNIGGGHHIAAEAKRLFGDLVSHRIGAYSDRAVIMLAHYGTAAQPDGDNIRHTEVGTYATDVNGDTALAGESVRQYTEVGSGTAHINHNRIITASQVAGTTNGVCGATCDGENRITPCIIKGHQSAVILGEVYLSQNDGTLMTLDNARRYPILTIACGPTNSIRGASYLTCRDDAIVIDVGGTTSDFGVLSHGFPRESGVAVDIGGVRTNFRMPDVISIGLGGGSIVREHDDGTVTVGPDSVGYQITEKALCFGGDVVTATDIADRLGKANVGDPSLTASISQEVADKAYAAMREMVEDAIDSMKISSDPIDAILVGGGAVLLPHDLAGTKSVACPEFAGCANAIGSAISKVSGMFEKLVDYEETGREEALEHARREAIAAAVRAGADEATVEIIDSEDVPLAYYPGKTSRIRIKAAGDLRMAQTEK